MSVLMENRIKQEIGRSYMNDPHANESSAFVEKCYREFVRVNNELFARIPFEVRFTSEDVYTSAKDMRRRVIAENCIFIYNGWSGHPFLTEEENLISRAVHDVYAHLVCGCPFTFKGEFNAYLEQRKHYPRWTWNVLFTEIPAQTAAYYYIGKFPETQQRAFIAPTEWMELCDLYLQEDFSENSVFTLA